ncbi:DTX3L [Branchiostoma lanceolatum]|uniref:DTX3L protein n=1 Tax=Branchiostoma lanceolatum TaxID=7740 RepID=A0A8K0ETF2_BRALA|nr:DTX3L [Branchiostoma lanceolatum]
MATASFTEKVSDDFIQCTICCYSFKNPKVLPCLHTFCEHCLREWVQKNDGDTFPCPICREQVSLPKHGVEGLKDNFFLASLVKAVTEDHKVRHGQDGLLCTTCEEGKPATSRCSECAEFLCESCESAHRLQRATKGHTLFTFEELKTGKYDGVFRTRKAPPCSKHSGEILKLYCRTCETPICNECALFEHRDSQHDYTRIEEVATEKRNTILHLTPQSQARMQFIQSTEDVQNRLKEQLQIHTEGARQNVHKTVQTLIALVKEEGERLLSCIDSEETMRKKQIEAEIEGAQISLASAKSTCEFAETLAREGGDYEVVSFSQDLTARLNELTKPPADTVDLKLANITVDYSVMGLKLKQNIPPSIQNSLSRTRERELRSLLKRTSSTGAGHGPKQTRALATVSRTAPAIPVYPGPGKSTPVYPHPTPNYSSGHLSHTYPGAIPMQPSPSQSVSSLRQAHPTSSQNISSFSSPSSASKNSDQADTCPICLCDFTGTVTTTPCKHKFCADCLKSALKLSGQCPICKSVIGLLKGDQPRGTMTDRIDYLNTLPGYEYSRYTIEIHYYFPDGVQGSEHPNPGKPYTGTSQTAYLPDNAEGREVLKLLKRAFDSHLVFTIGTSATTGQTDTVVWNDIHHKTNRFGGPNSYGYPDPQYLTRVKEQLAAKGIK